MTLLPGARDGQWPDGTFWLHAGWLIDGSGRAAFRDNFVEVCNGFISRVTAKAPDSPFDNLINLGHVTVIPMLMDAHVHLALSGTRDAGQRQEQLTFDIEQTGNVISGHLASHWRHGVSAVREAGDCRGSVWHHLRCLTDSRRPPVSVAVTRWAWHAPGRYGTMIGRTPDSGIRLFQAAAEYFSDIDHVKVIHSGINSIDRFGHQGPPQFPKKDLAELVHQAHRRKVKVMVHANGEAPVRWAIDAGCDSIEHGYFMGRQNLERMADRSIAWVPTVVPMAALARSEHLTSSQKDTANRTVEHQLEQIHHAKAFGVRIGLGTDAGSPGVDHGAAVQKELGLLRSAGLSLEEAISCATAENAALLGRQRCGTLVPGQWADLLVIPHEPDRLIENLGAITAKCSHGQWYR